jgi:hypothetical protein
MDHCPSTLVATDLPATIAVAFSGRMYASCAAQWLAVWFAKLKLPMGPMHPILLEKNANVAKKT